MDVSYGPPSVAGPLLLPDMFIDSGKNKQKKKLSRRLRRRSFALVKSNLLLLLSAGWVELISAFWNQQMEFRDFRCV